MLSATSYRMLKTSLPSVSKLDFAVAPAGKEEMLNLIKLQLHSILRLNVPEVVTNSRDASLKSDVETGYEKKS